MMDRRIFAIFTALVLLSLLFFYSREMFRVYRITVRGDESFKEAVEKAFLDRRVRFEIVEDSNIVFDQGKSTLKIDGKIYHLYWKDSTLYMIRKELQLRGLDIDSLRIVPEGGMEEVLKGAVDIVRSGHSHAFSEGYLAIPVEILDSSGNLLMKFDPVKMEFEY